MTRTVLISARILLLPFLTIFFSAANCQVAVDGVVTDASTGEALAGVNIIIKNTTSGTTSNANGAFEINLPGPGNQLVFTFMGMITQDIAIHGDTSLVVMMEPDLLQMEGVVVTAIGIEREKKALGYAVQEIPSIEMKKIPYDNFLNSITARASGVQVTSSSGSAGASSYITIRGAASIDGNNQPLFILDGIPIANTSEYHSMGGVDMSNRAMDLNPNDIESISVLKGGAAAALYGIRAANGAIVITSRRGEQLPGRKISTIFSTSLTFDRVSQLPEVQDKYGQGFYGMWLSGVPTTWGPRLDTCSYTRDPALWQYPEFDVDGVITGQNDPAATGEQVKTYNPYDFFQDALSQQYNLELSGGGDKARFLTSTSYTNTEGVVPGNRWQRFTLKLRGDVDISDNFNLFGSATYIRSGGDRMQKGSNTSGVMLGLLRTPATFDNAAGYELEDGSQRNYQRGSGYDNPYWTVNKNSFKDNVDRLIFLAGFDWSIRPWLKLKYLAGLDHFSEDWNNFFAIGSNRADNGQIWVRKNNQRDFNSDIMLVAEHRFSDDWQARFTLGQNMFETYSNEIESVANGLEIPGYNNLNNTNDLSTTEYTRQIRRAAFYGVLDVSFRNMFYLTLTGRNEWSTTMPASNNSFFYPSASLSWVFTELFSSSILPFGKLRFSAAQIANDADPYRTTTGFTTYRISTTFTNGLSFPLMGQSGFTLSNTLGKENLKPERTNTWEIGTDLRWLDNRIALDVTWFQQYNKDLLLRVPVSNTTGYYFHYMNAGEMSTKGIEVILAAQPVRNVDWQWRTTFNFSRLKNKVEKLTEGIEGIPFTAGSVIIGAAEGFPYQTMLSYDWYRDDAGNVIIDDNPESASYGFPVGNYDTLVHVGDYQPDWLLGWSNTVRWKNLSLSFLIDVKVGGKLYNGTRGSMYYFGVHGDQESREPEDQVVFEGVKYSDGSTNDIPVVKDARWYFFGEGSTFTGPGAPYAEEAGWVRLRQVTLSYDFEPLLKDGFIRALTVYVSGRNLWLHTKYTGIDPETSLWGSSNAQGEDYYNMPGTKGITVGARLAF
jgi:TonB-linked SusC/RagA family outer membrane protein